MSISNKKPSPRYIISIRGSKFDLRYIILPFITLVLIFLSILFLSTEDTLLIDKIVDLIYNIFPLPVFPDPRAPYIGRLIWNIFELSYSFVYIYLIILGIINLLSIVQMAILGFILPNKPQPSKNIPYDKRSGDQNGAIPSELPKWNWGAACFSYIWATSYGAWSTLWTLLLLPIPVINIFVFILFGLKGNQWAWRSQKWESVEKFIEAQNKWATNLTGLFFFTLLIILLILSTVVLPFTVYWEAYNF